MPSRITPEKEAEICRLYQENIAISEIGRRTGVGNVTVHRTLSRQGITKNRMTGPRTKIPCDDQFFDTIDSEEKAYWLGFLMADGSVGQSSSGARQLSVRLSLRDKDHISRFAQAIRSEHTITTGSAILTRTRKKYDFATLRIVRSKLVQGLNKNGMVHPKSARETFSTVPNELKNHFIRGVFDGDGSWITHRKHLVFQIGSVSVRVLREISTILIDNCDLKTGLEPKPSKNSKAFYIRWEGNRKCRRLFDYIYKNATVMLPRKYEKARTHFFP